jgi:hypothetical protein
LALVLKFAFRLILKEFFGENLDLSNMSLALSFWDFDSITTEVLYPACTRAWFMVAYNVSKGINAEWSPNSLRLLLKTSLVKLRTLYLIKTAYYCGLENGCHLGAELVFIFTSC